MRIFKANGNTTTVVSGLLKAESRLAEKQQVCQSAAWRNWPRPLAPTDTCRRGWREPEQDHDTDTIRDLVSGPSKFSSFCKLALGSTPVRVI